ncbi:MAG: hypothetical protein GX303_02495, partial [Clostridiales bacterium]|nr:hypothetical protein [Clostridiales bacterium]
DYVSPHVNYLSYRTSYDYIESVYRPVIERFQNKMGRVIDCLFYHDVQYVTPNRRMWDEDFNRVFEAEFGYDPAPYYPALFRQIGADTSHYKALFFHCRAKLLQNGFLKAIADFCKTHSLWCVGTQSGAKFPACSFLHGDGMMASRYADAPCAQMSGAYLYGQNSLKIAEGAAAGVGGETVAAEMFDGYEESTPPLLYREMILSYSKRINHIFAHLPPTKGVTTLSERLRQAFFDGDGSHLWPAARTQALLSEGRQICDIALLYPIYSLHEEAYLYEDNHTHGYEFASIPENADYMNVINAITEYVGLDLTVLHPEIIKEGCRTEGGRLILETVAGTAEYRVVVLPAGCLIGIDTLRLLKRFYDEGGKIVATGELPAAAFEFDGEYGSDEEVVRTILHIFGTECFNLGSIRKYCENQNDRGGQAYFFYSTMSALDGTYTVSGNLLEEVFKSFRLPYDVVLADPPHRETGGLLNIPLHEYLAMDKYYHINKTGTVSYIHKEAEGADIYYFANSRSEEEYLDRVLLRGRKELELWNPRTGEIESCPCEHTVENGQPYTKILLRLPPASGIFVVAKV